MKLKKMFRAAGAEDVKLDVEKRTVTFPFSSEHPVDRWFGTEILSHDDGSADLARLNDGASLLWNHNWDTVIGVIERAWRGPDKRMWCEARFSKSAEADRVMKDVEDKILRNVSFGYRIHDMLERVKDGVSEFLCTKWEPFEVSIVSIPADPTVGIGRADSDEENEVRVTTNKLAGSEKERKTMDEEEQKKADAARAAEVKQAGADGAKAERDRIQAITKLGENHQMPELARSLVDGGKSIDEARGAFLEKLGTRQKPVSESGTDADVGLSEKEIEKFSFMRIVRALSNPNDRRAQEAASFEREVSEAALKSGQPMKGTGFRIPFEVLRHGKPFMKRDLLVGTSTAGGHTVATDLLAASFIDLLRNSMVTDRAGARIMNGLQGNVAIPRQTSGGTAYYVAENSALTESQQAFDQVTLSPKTVGAYTDFSRLLTMQSSIDVEAFVKQDLAQILGIEIDRAALYGSGSSNQPLGVKNVSGINSVDFSADAPTYAEIVSMETEVAADNALLGSPKFLTSARGRGVLKGVYTNATYGEIPVWKDGMVNGYEALVSNQISLVSGAKYHYWLGNWSDLLIGFWSGLDLIVDPYAGALAGTVRIIAMQNFDVAVRHPESFCLGANLT